jgi:hypothetical protein
VCDDTTVCVLVVGLDALDGAWVVLPVEAVPPVAELPGRAAVAPDPLLDLPLEEDPGDLPEPAGAEDDAPCDAPALGADTALPLAAGTVVPAAGMNLPVRFQNAEKPLNGPPTTWLDHCRT